MKVRQTETRKEGRSLNTYERVIEVDEAPQGATIVDEATPLSDWRRVEN